MLPEEAEVEIEARSISSEAWKGGRPLDEQIEAHHEKRKKYSKSVQNMQVEIKKWSSYFID